MTDRGKLATMGQRVRPPHPGWRPATDQGRPDMWLSTPLFRAVAIHLLRHLVPEIHADGAPPVLAVQGPWGEGKTAMTAEVVRRMGHDSVTAIAASFEKSGKGGATVDAWDELKEGLLATSALTPRRLVLLLPDFDTLISMDEDVSRTENIQLFLGAWNADMDRGLKDANGHPIPVIVDGNDFSELVRGSAMRPGRAEFFELTIEPDERRQMVSAMFGVKPDDVSRLVEEHPDKPLAFFRDLKVKAFNDDLFALFQQHGFDPAAIGAAWSAQKAKGVDMDRLLAAARAADKQKAKRFLGWK